MYAIPFQAVGHLWFISRTLLQPPSGVKGFFYGSHYEPSMKGQWLPGKIFSHACSKAPRWLSRNFWSFLTGNSVSSATFTLFQSSQFPMPKISGQGVDSFPDVMTGWVMTVSWMMIQYTIPNINKNEFA